MTAMRLECDQPMEIAVIGAGISGMSAAWLLSQRHNVTVYESQDRCGGHSHTVDAPRPGGGSTPVDMGFIVYNDTNYPNLVALFDHLGVPTKASEMTFSVSLDDGRLEYAPNNLATLFAQPSNLVSARFWSMLRDILRFYKHAPTHACALDGRLTTLGEYLGAQGYGCAFQDDHLLPQAAAIWSAPVGSIRDYPADAFTPLFNRFAPRVKSYLTRLGASAAAAEELAQETMLSVWRKAAQFDPARAGASTWIFTIARNLRIDALRKERPQPLEEDPTDVAPEPAADAVVFAAERDVRVRAALKVLSPEQAEVIELSFFTEAAHSEIAERLGLPLGTVKSRLRLAMTRLRSLLEDLR